jgi:mRNA interferase RelE/StbE
MSGSSPYAIDFAPAARRGLARLPLSAATALHEHLTGPMAGNPYRLGKPLEAPFDDVWTTRRGDYRALYSIDDRKHTITGLAVAHRRDAYRPR